MSNNIIIETIDKLLKELSVLKNSNVQKDLELEKLRADNLSLANKINQITTATENLPNKKGSHHRDVCLQTDAPPDTFISDSYNKSGLVYEPQQQDSDGFSTHSLDIMDLVKDRESHIKSIHDGRFTYEYAK